MALLGWNPGTEQEIFTLEELVAAFSIDRVHQAGAIFDREKMLWVNQQHMKRYTHLELTRLAEPFLLQQHGVPWQDFPNKEHAVAIVRERARTLTEIADGVGFLLTLPEYEITLLVPKKGSPQRADEALRAAQEILQSIASRTMWFNECLRNMLQQSA